MPITIAERSSPQKRRPERRTRVPFPAPAVHAATPRVIEPVHESPERPDMTPLFKKLNLGDRREILVLEAPASFDEELARLEGVRTTRTTEVDKPASFVVAFAVTQAALDRLSATVAGATEGDAVVWMAYPKGTSKKYRCEFNRDSGWTVLGNAGFEAVRQVSIDEDWSALRFRRIEFVKSLTRSRSNAVSPEGKRRATKP